ncbi:adenylyl-sulfate kinase [Paenibacillus yanchengensis]|uniref:Adenylyl-sulfate kinase n=1 Tax=Paenibacillus yanchengensis TaxID=2035833 RepID=A0ABW4YN39_9BACL
MSFSTEGPSQNIVWHEQMITKENKRLANNHHSVVFYFTGLSGSGKSTIANLAAKQLFEQGAQTYVLDGDNVRHGLNKDLGFTEEARQENIRRIGEVAKLFVDSGQIVFTAFISPYESDRAMVRQLLEADEFVEVYVACPLTVCEERDPKGLYRKARSGEIANFTGISAPYEAPTAPDVILQTDVYTTEQCVQQIFDYMKQRNWMK